MLCSIPECPNVATIKHHISYFPEVTTGVCEPCHTDIHQGKHPELIKYQKGDSREFYSQKRRIERAVKSICRRICN